MDRYVFLFLALIGVLTSVACGSPITQQGAEQQQYNNFKTVVATAPQDGYTAYWLGTGFEAGGLTFKGPFTAGFAQEVAGGGVSTDYDAAVDGGVASLTISSYSPAAWATSPRRLDSSQPGATSAAATAGARGATVIGVPLNNRPNFLEVVLQIGDTMVVASTHADASHPNATPNPNPLVDQQTLLAVLAHLRPYPQ